MKVLQENQRMHGIDTLRAIAMLLGIVLHSTIAYKTIPLPNWPSDVKNSYMSMDLMYEFIHSFRMPLFYVIAGYFSKMILDRYGVRIFIKKRWERIGIPFVFSLLFILPFSIYPFLFYHYSQVDSNDLQQIFTESNRALLRWNGMAHLWFLYYLLVFYAIVIAAKMVNVFQGMNEKINSVLFIASITLLTCLVLLDEKELYIQVDTGFFPAARYILFYLIFYLAGYFIFKRQNLLLQLTRYSLQILAVSILLFLSLFYIHMFHHEFINNGWSRVVVKFLTSIQIVLLVGGVIGFFVKFFDSESYFWKYISDASYWMYLVHLGIVAGLEVFLLYTEVPGMLRFPIVLSLSLTVSLSSYQLFIRYSFVGRWLHGKRVRNPSGGGHVIISENV